MSVPTYTCAEILSPLDGDVSYEIRDPEGHFLAEIKDYGQVENLLHHLNCFITRRTAYN